MLRFGMAASAALILAVSATTALADPPASAAPAASAAPDPLSTAEGQKKFLSELHPQKGDVLLHGASVTLHLGTGYYFLGADDSRKVLVDAWGNTKDTADGVLGMVFPSGQTPLDGHGWGAVVSFAGTGYVSDKDARTTDYAKVLDELRKGEDETNDERKKENRETAHLVGWAQAPNYDENHHSLIWARDIKFGDQTDDTLNYDVRVLGRRGVLNLNMVATMSQLPEIRTAANQLQGVAVFDSGSRYADYQQGVDKRAEYGLAGLILAGAGLAVAKKVGLIALALIFLKKGFVVILAAMAGFWAWLKRFFTGRKAT